MKRVGLLAALVMGAAAWCVASVATAREPSSGCEGKCLADYEAAAAKCGVMEDEGERRVCQGNAGVRYRSCLAGCPQGSGDADVEACKRRCDGKATRAHRRCAKMPEGSPERAKCRQAVEEQRATCQRDCERKG